MTVKPTTALPTRRLGDSGLEVSLVGLGCNNFGGRLDRERTGLAAAERVAGDEQFDVAEAIGAYAKGRGIGSIDVAIAGLAAQPAVGSVIAGATRPEQVAANVAALRWQPSAEDLAELDRIAPTSRRLGPKHPTRSAFRVEPLGGSGPASPTRAWDG